MQVLWWGREAENGDGAESMNPAFIQLPLLSSSGNLSGAASNSPPFILLDVNVILVHQEPWEAGEIPLHPTFTPALVQGKE